MDQTTQTNQKILDYVTKLSIPIDDILKKCNAISEIVIDRSFIESELLVNPGQISYPVDAAKLALATYNESIIGGYHKISAIIEQILTTQSLPKAKENIIEKFLLNKHVPLNKIDNIITKLLKKDEIVLINGVRYDYDSIINEILTDETFIYNYKLEFIRNKKIHDEWKKFIAKNVSKIKKNIKKVDNMVISISSKESLKRKKELKIKLEKMLSSKNILSLLWNLMFYPGDGVIHFVAQLKELITLGDYIDIIIQFDITDSDQNELYTLLTDLNNDLNKMADYILPKAIEKTLKTDSGDIKNGDMIWTIEQLLLMKNIDKNLIAELSSYLTYNDKIGFINKINEISSGIFSNANIENKIREEQLIQIRKVLRNILDDLNLLYDIDSIKNSKIINYIINYENHPNKKTPLKDLNLENLSVAVNNFIPIAKDVLNNLKTLKQEIEGIDNNEQLQKILNKIKDLCNELRNQDEYKLAGLEHANIFNLSEILSSKSRYFINWLKENFARIIENITAKKPDQKEQLLKLVNDAIEKYDNKLEEIENPPDKTDNILMVITQIIQEAKKEDIDVELLKSLASHVKKSTYIKEIIEDINNKIEYNLNKLSQIDINLDLDIPIQNDKISEYKDKIQNKIEELKNVKNELQPSQGIKQSEEKLDKSFEVFKENINSLIEKFKDSIDKTKPSRVELIRYNVEAREKISEIISTLEKYINEINKYNQELDLDNVEELKNVAEALFNYLREQQNNYVIKRFENEYNRKGSNVFSDLDTIINLDYQEAELYKPVEKEEDPVIQWYKDINFVDKYGNIDTIIRNQNNKIKLLHEDKELDSDRIINLIEQTQSKAQDFIKTKLKDTDEKVKQYIIDRLSDTINDNAKELAYKHKIQDKIFTLRKDNNDLLADRYTKLLSKDLPDDIYIKLLKMTIDIQGKNELIINTLYTHIDEALKINTNDIFKINGHLKSIQSYIKDIAQNILEIDESNINNYTLILQRMYNNLNIKFQNLKKSDNKNDVIPIIELILEETQQTILWLQNIVATNDPYIQNLYSLKIRTSENLTFANRMKQKFEQIRDHIKQDALIKLEKQFEQKSQFLADKLEGDELEEELEELEEDYEKTKVMIDKIIKNEPNDSIEYLESYEEAQSILREISEKSADYIIQIFGEDDFKNMVRIKNSLAEFHDSVLTQYKAVNTIKQLLSEYKIDDPQKLKEILINFITKNIKEIDRDKFVETDKGKIEINYDNNKNIYKLLINIIDEEHVKLDVSLNLIIIDIDSIIKEYIQIIKSSKKSPMEQTVTQLSIKNTTDILDEIDNIIDIDKIYINSQEGKIDEEQFIDYVRVLFNKFKEQYNEEEWDYTIRFIKFVELKDEDGEYYVNTLNKYIQSLNRFYDKNIFDIVPTPEQLMDESEKLNIMRKLLRKKELRKIFGIGSIDIKKYAEKLKVIGESMDEYDKDLSIIHNTPLDVQIIDIYKNMICKNRELDFDESVINNYPAFKKFTNPRSYMDKADLSLLFHYTEHLLSIDKFKYSDDSNYQYVVTIMMAYLIISVIYFHNQNKYNEETEIGDNIRNSVKEYFIDTVAFILYHYKQSNTTDKSLDDMIQLLSTEYAGIEKFKIGKTKTWETILENGVAKFAADTREIELDNTIWDKINSWC